MATIIVPAEPRIVVGIKPCQDQIIEVGAEPTILACFPPITIIVAGHCADIPDEEEGPPPPGPEILLFTSKPYPVIAIDAMTVRGEVRQARLWKGLVDAYQLGASIPTFELRPILRNLTIEPDATALALAEITGMELKTVLRATAAEPEATARAGLVTSLTLASKLVATTVEPEAVQPTGTITGLELS